MRCQEKRGSIYDKCFFNPSPVPSKILLNFLKDRHKKAKKRFQRYAAEVNMPEKSGKSLRCPAPVQMKTMNSFYSLSFYVLHSYR